MKKAEAKGTNDSILNRLNPGFTITIIPIKPIKIAMIRCIPIFSPNIGNANRVAIIGDK